MMTVDDYLGIPAAYGRWLGGLQWSPNGEAVEFSADDPEIGLTFAMSVEVARFLEGLSEDSIVHFSFVLHLMSLLGCGDRPGTPGPPERSPESQVLVRAFRKTGRRARNAGALCSVLCRGVPRVPDPPSLEVVLRQLSQPSPMRYAILRKYPGEEPPLEPREFEQRVKATLRGYSPDDLRCWLRHGRGPVGEAGETIAGTMPVSLAEVLAAAECRPRLRGAAGLVARLDGALALPPRRLAHRELPIGGYSDITTRGRPEQILPAQLALDPDEFVRRFAERELLYFHREEPRSPTARELVLVIDQGVRTWGDVRLVLAAASLALGRQAARRELALRIATSGDEGRLVDVVGATASRLGELLEASDLSPHPAAALGSVLGSISSDPGPRDVVILTHPKSLAQPEVVAAAALAGGETRLFAVAAAPSGEVSLSELRHGIPVAIARCRVDPGGAGVPEKVVTAVSSPTGGWRGDVESIGFPFQLGVRSPFTDRLFGFGDAGDWILLAGEHGLLYAWRADGTAAEMLPRARVDGMVLDEVNAVVGVAGGFAVAGRMGSLAILVHYDFHRRHCSAHKLGGPWERPLSWSYFRHLHSLVAGIGHEPILAVDLARDPSHAPYPERGEGPSRAQDAYRLFAKEGPAGTIVASSEATIPRRGRAVRLSPALGRFEIWDDSGAWRHEIPLSEGRRKFLGARLIQARWHGDVIASLVAHPSGKRAIHLFSLAGHWRSLGEHAVGDDVEDFALSRDGRRLAWRNGYRQILVRDIEDDGPPTPLGPKGRFHPDIDAALGDGFFAVKAGRHAHLVRWDLDRLELVRAVGSVANLIDRVYGKSRVVDMVGASRPRPGTVADPKRIIATARHAGLTLAVDRFSQVLILQPREELVCMFYFSLDQAAAWAPDGSKVGPPALLGGPETPHGAEKIAARIRSAAEAGRRDGP
jgi:hypothetical protein